MASQLDAGNFSTEKLLRSPQPVMFSGIQLSSERYAQTEITFMPDWEKEDLWK